tara:strand:+ start:6284 stop:6691 length:408 start_codon:yes stop_codon:yes gene_type:complete
VTRSRLYVFLALVLTIALGLASRSTSTNVPGFFAVHAGDALWTVALWLSLALVRPDARSFVLTILALGISFLVEISQLWHPDWLDALRSTTFGALALGTDWDALDPARYVAGALLVVTVDRIGLLRSKSSSDSVS